MSLFLVTGGCGFIGSHLADALIHRGDRVRILDDLSTGKMENAPAEADVRIGSITDPAAVEAAMDGVDGCFHLAAVASVVRSNEDWLGTHAINQTGSIYLFEQAASAPRRPPVVYASSAAIYGDNEDIPLGETASPRPLTAYGADKLGSELHARVAGAVHRVPTTGFRFFNVYGRRQDPASPYSGVISIFADRLARGLPITIFGDGEQSRDFVHVSDVVRHLIAGMRHATIEAPVYNVCTGTAVSVNQLAQALAAALSAVAEIRYAPSRTGDIRRSIGDGRAASAALGVHGRMPLREGLADLVSARPVSVLAAPTQIASQIATRN